MFLGMSVFEAQLSLKLAREMHTYAQNIACTDAVTDAAAAASKLWLELRAKP